LFLNCSEQSSPITPEAIDSTNIPQIINTENYFSFKIRADSLTNSFQELLSFSTDSLHAYLQISNIEERKYMGWVRLQTEDSLVLYSKSLGENLSDPEVNLFGNIPYKLNFSLSEFTGDISFILRRNTYIDTIDTAKTHKHPDAIYFNSFESLDDILPFNGYGDFHLNYEVPIGGGEKSLYISGGCIVPHVYYFFPPNEEDSYYVLQCFGKTTSYGGVVSLRLGNRGPFIKVDIQPNENIWTYYRTADTLFCPQDSVMMLRMSSNYSSMLIDLLQIIKLK